MGESSGDKLLGVLAHVSFFFLPIILPLILLLVSQDRFVKHHARQALMSHLFLWLAGGIAGLLCIILIGFILLPIVGIFGLVVTIIAITHTLNGEYYRYPITGYWFE
jgi:uncharacterized protein